MPEDKVEETVRRTIRTTNQTAIAAQGMKDAYLHTKEKAETAMYANESSSEEYAADLLEDGERSIARDAMHMAENAASFACCKIRCVKSYESVEGSKEIKIRTEDRIKHLPELDKVGTTDSGGSPVVKETENNRRNFSGKSESIQHASEKKGVQHRQLDRLRGKVSTHREMLEAPIYGGQVAEQQMLEKAEKFSPEIPDRIKTAPKLEKTIKQSARSMGKVRVKETEKMNRNLTGKTVKTSERTSKTAIKTLEKAEKKTAVTTAKTSYKLAQTSRMAVRSAMEQAKTAARATVEAVRAIVAAAKSLITWIVSGSGMAICVVIVICLVGMIAGSAMGVFFSGEGNGEDTSLRDVIKEINKEYSEKLNRIGENVPHDQLEVVNSEIEWEEILSVYAILTNREGQEVVTVDDEKAKLLHALFWQMTEISWDTVEIENPDGSQHKPRPNLPSHPTLPTTDSPDQAEESEPPMLIKLVISVEHRTANQMALIYDYTAEETNMQRELLKPGNKRLWREIIYGLKFVHINGWVQPLEKLSVASPFGFRVHPISGEWKLHAGVDLDADEGTPILAIRDGTVRSAGFNDSMGNYVIIDHGEGFESESMHMIYSVVHSGEAVEAGDIIGYVGSTGASTGPHLHLGVIYNGEYIDPMLLFSQSNSEVSEE